ncbi:unnamed protein product [Brachionus calyciflorus]|uniref:Uncharacterized protein n=1 Tax=Brachionus calyciflorus TaxID=104777 RepID=A0A814J9P5_9BILA|nr:unnamed protein product [Brachionus calyciflorus]
MENLAFYGSFTAITLFLSWDLWTRNQKVKVLKHENHLCFIEIEALKQEIKQLKFEFEKSKFNKNLDATNINKRNIIFKAKNLHSTLKQLINNLNKIKPIDNSLKWLFFLNILNIYKILTAKSYAFNINANNILNGSSNIFMCILYNLNWISLFASFFIMNQNLSLNDVTDEKIAYLNEESIETSKLLNIE